MIIVIGEILIDEFPDYERMGGAPFNFAFHLKKLGFPVRFITRVGDDHNGRRIIDRLKQSGFNPMDIQVDSRHPTGSVRVDLGPQGVPHFDICEDAAYDHLELDAGAAPGGPAPELIYFGTLLQRTASGSRRVQRFLARHAGATRFCDINLRPPHVDAHVIADSLRQADLLKLNQEELADIQRLLDGPPAAGDLMPWLMKSFAINAVALTRGGRGSALFSRDEETSRPAVEGTAIVDTVGAGDGYAAILAAGYLRGLAWDETIDQASRFAARICAIPGAIPDDDAFYDDFRSLGKGYADDR